MQTNLTVLQQQIEKDFGLLVEPNFDALKQKLTEHLVYLLVNDLEKLWGILYRIDVNEQKVKSLFSLNNPKEIAPQIADMIIERQMQKIESRKKYR